MNGMRGIKLAKHKSFDCTIWESGIVIVTERLPSKKGEIGVKVGKAFQGTLEELSKNYKRLFQEGKNLSEKEIEVFKLEKPKSFRDLLAQIEFISKDMKNWTDKLISINKTARKGIELISEDNVGDAFYNISQNIKELTELIQKKVKGV